MPVSSDITIVGGGQAAARAFAAVRGLAPEMPVTLFSEESHLPYERPPLSKECLHEGGLSEPHLVIPDSEYRHPATDLRLGSRVVRIDREKHRIETAAGDCHSYSKLLIATGARARVLSDVSGSGNILYLRNFEDAMTLADRLKFCRDLVIIGGGAIGTEIAAVAAERSIRVTVIEAGSRLLARAVCQTTSDLLRDCHLSRGVRVQFNSAVKVVSGGSVVLNDGSEIAADLVVAAIGVVPNAELAEQAGLEVSNGILTDDYCRTSDPDIYAAGDVANYYERYLGRQFRSESWAEANMQGMRAAQAMLGLEVTKPAVPSFWTDQFGISFQMCGDVTSDDIEVRGNLAAHQGAIVHFDGNRVVGATCLNNPREFRLLNRMIRDATVLDRTAIRNQSQPVTQSVIDAAA
ncbi:MAG: FAD-dependent oxidoreductase [Rhodospirillales bacterium]